MTGALVVLGDVTRLPAEALAPPYPGAAWTVKVATTPDEARALMEDGPYDLLVILTSVPAPPDFETWLVESETPVVRPPDDPQAVRNLIAQALERADTDRKLSNLRNLG